MFIPDPDFYPSRILDPGSTRATKGEGKNLFLSFCEGADYRCRIENYFIFEHYRKKSEQRIIVLFTKKLSLSS
jgi:hypothetical protein